MATKVKVEFILELYGRERNTADQIQCDIENILSEYEFIGRIPPACDLKVTELKV